MNLLFKFKRGFNIFETVAIILLLAIIIGIAAPLYLKLVAHSKLEKVVGILDTYISELKKEYQTNNEMPQTLLGVPNGQFIENKDSKYIDYIYYDNGSTWPNQGKAAMVQVVISNRVGNGIHGFTEGPSGTHNRITMAILHKDGYLETFCGTWQTDGTEIPAKYLPPGCDQVNISTTVTGYIFLTALDNLSSLI